VFTRILDPIGPLLEDIRAADFVGTSIVLGKHHRVACRRGMVANASDASQPPLHADKRPMVASQSKALDLVTASARRRHGSRSDASGWVGKILSDDRQISRLSRIDFDKLTIRFWLLLVMRIGVERFEQNG